MDLAKIKDYDSIKQWSYSLARQYAQKEIVPKGVKSKQDFVNYGNKHGLPAHYPRRPDDYFRYRGTWVSWYDFLGKDRSSAQKKDFYDFETCATIVRRAGIHNSVAFRKWKNRPSKVPSQPEFYYSEWKGWIDFLGDSYHIEKTKNNCKLSERDVRIIKQQLQLGISGRYLAQHFGVSEMQISRIRRGENWNDL